MGPSARATPARPAESRCLLRSDLLIGRGDELEALAASVARPARGVVVVEGEPGIGKSRLVEEALAGVEGREVYRVSASWASAVPLSPWAELLRAMARSRGHAAAVAAAGGAAAVLAGLVPELGPAGSASGPRAADLVPWFFARLLDGAPAVVVIEDAHEADPLSLDVLRRTAAQADPVLWIITAREVPDGPWAQARTELIRGEAAHHVLLGPLAPVEMRALVEHLAGFDLDEAQAARCAELSAGNPFLAEELVAATRRGGAPAEAAGAVSGRLEALGPAARQAARAAAVYGAPVAHGQLRELTGFGERELLDAVREAVAADVLAATVDGCYSLRHALVGEAARAELLPVERARLHAAVARMLEEDARANAARRRQAPDPAALAAAAGHWEAAGRLDLAQPAHVGPLMPCASSIRGRPRRTTGARWSCPARRRTPSWTPAGWSGARPARRRRETTRARSRWPGAHSTGAGCRPCRSPGSPCCWPSTGPRSWLTTRSAPRTSGRSSWPAGRGRAGRAPSWRLRWRRTAATGSSSTATARRCAGRRGPCRWPSGPEPRASWRSPAAPRGRAAATSGASPTACPSCVRLWTASSAPVARTTRRGPG